MAPTLLDFTITSVNDRGPCGRKSGIRSPPIRIAPALTSNTSSLSTSRSSKAAEAVTTLNVDPGSYRSWTARFRSRSGVEARNAFGLKVGSLASANTSPVRGSSITTAPASAS